MPKLTDGIVWRKWNFWSGNVYHGYLADFLRSLQIEKRATDEGRNNLPPTDAAERSPVEHQLDHRIAANADAIKQGLWRNRKSAIDGIGRCIPEKLEFRGIADATALAIRRLFDRARPKLVTLRKDERDRVRDLKSFQ